MEKMLNYGMFNVEDIKLQSTSGGSKSKNVKSKTWTKFQKRGKTCRDSIKPGKDGF